MLFYTIACIGFFSCTKDSDCTVATINPEENPFPTGWDPNNEKSDSIQVFIDDFADCGNLPQSVNLTPRMPPIGDQGQSGTCLAWAAAYYTMTTIEGNVKGYSTSALANPSNQLSPKDLFWAIPESEKGHSQFGPCWGTTYFPALQVLQQRGVATMQTVPHANLGDCSPNGIQQSWENEAAQHKIDYFRRIEPLSVCAIKAQLAANNPVMFGASVGENWQLINDDRVFAELPTGNPGGHAMTVGGYDDSRHAFRIVNSWGTIWGDGGYAWVDYDFFVQKFVYPGDAFFAVYSGGGDTPPDINPNAGGVELASWVFSDLPTPQQGFPTVRTIFFNIYNIGTQTANAADEWEFQYIYYDAYDINKWGILFYDGFNENAPKNTYTQAPDGHFDFNFDIAAGSSFTGAVFNQDNIDRTYEVPDITGYYYLVLIADRTYTYDESNEFNNIFYTTGQWPKYFQNGQSNVSDGNVDDRSSDSKGQYQFKNDEHPTRTALQKNKFNTAVNDKVPNAYRPEEVRRFLKKQKETGGFYQKVAEYRQRTANREVNNYKTK